MKIGDEVEHPTLGKGVILKDWGTWCTCRQCGGDTPPPSFSLCPKCGFEKSETFSKRKRICRKDRKPLDLCYDIYACSKCGSKVGRPTFAICVTCETRGPNFQKFQSVLKVSGRNIFDIKFNGHVNKVVSLNACYLLTEDERARVGRPITEPPKEPRKVVRRDYDKEWAGGLPYEA